MTTTKTEISAAARNIVRVYNAELRRGAMNGTRLFFDADGELIGQAVGPEAWAPNGTHSTWSIGRDRRPLTRADVQAALDEQAEREQA